MKGKDAGLLFTSIVNAVEVVYLTSGTAGVSINNALRRQGRQAEVLSAVSMIGRLPADVVNYGIIPFLPIPRSPIPQDAPMPLNHALPQVAGLAAFNVWQFLTNDFYFKRTDLLLKSDFFILNASGLMVKFIPTILSVSFIDSFINDDNARMSFVGLHTLNLLVETAVLGGITQLVDE